MTALAIWIHGIDQSRASLAIPLGACRASTQRIHYCIVSYRTQPYEEHRHGEHPHPE